jgi:hypothetical protein
LFVQFNIISMQLKNMFKNILSGDKGIWSFRVQILFEVVAALTP